MVELSLREKIYRVIFGTDTAAGQYFDIALIYMILLSVLAIILDSIEAVNSQYGLWLFRLEWFFTLLFSVEYVARIYSSPKPLRYIFQFLWAGGSGVYFAYLSGVDLPWRQLLAGDSAAACAACLPGA